jgi:hypothetical protein
LASLSDLIGPQKQNFHVHIFNPIRTLSLTIVAAIRPECDDVENREMRSFAVRQASVIVDSIDSSCVQVVTLCGSICEIHSFVQVSVVSTIEITYEANGRMHAYND